MRKIELGQAIGILANLGVLVGILLLVYELSQNRQMMQAQTRTALAESISDRLFAIYSDQNLAGLWARGSAGEELSEAERNQFDGLRVAIYRYFENVHYQYRTGLYDEEEFAAQREQWRMLFSRKGVVDHWCRSQESYSPEFAAEIEQLLPAGACD